MLVIVFFCMINFQKELNSEQYKVIEQGDGPCLVLAGAGSGKTRTITYRVAYLLEQGVKPKNILLVTFTNKASKEMISRVEKLTRNPTPPSPYRGGNMLPWSGTFHHIGFRLLKKYATALGYKNNFSVLDNDDSLNLIKLCLKAEGIDRKEKRFPSPKVLQSIISYARNSETTIEDVLDLKYHNFLPIMDVLNRLADDYRKRKFEANAMDFDDLLVNWHLLLLKERNIKDMLAEQFQYVLVDEYQDTNRIQASIIDLLASRHNNLLVVGDDAQSIYSFRAADVSNILSFEKKYKDAKIFKLEINYRSTPDILQVANCVIANNLNQYEKKLQTEVENFCKPEVRAFADQTEEADFIVERIVELEDEGVGLEKISVLFRAAYQSQALEMALVKRGIDYDYRGGARFFERAHIKDTLAYLRIFNNAEDVLAWRRVLNMQVGIGAVSAEKIITEIGKNFLPLQGGGEPARNACMAGGEGVLDSGETPPFPSPHSGGKIKHIGSILGAKAQIGWSDFLQIYSALEPVLKSDSDYLVGDLIRIIAESKYSEYLENEYPDYRDRLRDLEQLAVSGDKSSDLNKFLGEAVLQEGYNAKQINSNSGGEKIILSTIHQAKGLEWEAVFVIGVASGQFPSERSRLELNGLEEERRLFYVAITRAKKYLHLTYPLTGGWGDSLPGPSVFIDEIDIDLVDNDYARQKNVFSDDTDDIEYVRDDDVPFESGSFLRRVEDL